MPAEPVTLPPGLVVLQFVLGLCRQIGDKARGAFGDSARPDRKLQWGTHVPEAAEVSADMIDLDPGLFSWFKRSAAWLRTTNAEIKLLGEISSYLGALDGYITDLVATRRDDLFRAVQDLHAGIGSAQQSPLTAPEVSARLQEIARPLQDLMARRAETAAAKKRLTLQKGAEVEGLTSQVLALGGTPPAPRRRTRR